MTFVALILTLDNFIFKSKFYLQGKSPLYENDLRPFIWDYFYVKIRRKKYLPYNTKQIFNILMLHILHFYGVG